MATKLPSSETKSSPEEVTVTINGQPVKIELPDKYSTNPKDYVPYISLGLTGILFMVAQVLHLDKVFDTSTVYGFSTGLAFFIVSGITTWRHNPVTKKAKQKQAIANVVYKEINNNSTDKEL